ncbi:MAG: ATP-dependent sacrificial sulfur transferase LarE [Planctomycetaceae bacterium]|jgi:pyridinium-3,5-biscarboxylic acid mononucleotide sulfurtransferase|nr:ATP-dependent sacrificial sulfur transferase LarE [Planctomycetaceae bacterium]MBT4725229.1 ATP-dependent sacrificial sulfur transferase LarE [Planctomycetaceae bacterium]MBT4846821.1 ATP-dependent sacrificial sulfur transferase LarE [Planctomycetaceae bacterium]MBT5123020.1 ATP-dependent sacrificial sulfur transferase LarE [Planctomycetaceae bacterium]MBT5598337.1 ATP-dependent sacrificial sulfur transferase LarE [Planctomycetaceae bacterium]
MSLAAPQSESLSIAQISKRAQTLVRFIAQYEFCAVALSAGVDSSVVAKAAFLAVGDRALAVTAQSASLARGELQLAQQTAALIGIRHQVIETAEFENADYLRNADDRCYHCKTELYQKLQSLATDTGYVLLSGTNLDDLGDFRPGLVAGVEHQVVTPLADCRLDKTMVRGIAKFWDLPVWDRPANPCLSSRIAYGETVTPERLAMVDAAECFLRSRGFTDVRVRCHRDNLARVEVNAEQICDLTGDSMRQAVDAKLRSLGFAFVTIDLRGFQSGSLNQLLQIQT